MSSTRQQLRAGRARTLGLALSVGALVIGYGGTAALAQSTSPAAMGEAHTVNAVTTDALGTFLTGEDGRTLYFFAKDTAPGASACEGGCVDNWPLFTLEAGETLAAGEGVTGVLSSFTRADGTMQGTYDGRPLYYFIGDAVAGDVLGQGLNDVWFVAMEDGSLAAPVASPAAAGAVTTVNAMTTDALGTFLTDGAGRTLYFFAKDTAPGASACEGGCVDNWPLLTVAADGSLAAGEGVTGVLSAFPRADGTLQATYDGRPLYYFIGDAAAGDVLGQGLSDVWFVAAVDGKLPAAQ